MSPPHSPLPESLILQNAENARQARSQLIEIHDEPHIDSGFDSPAAFPDGMLGILFGFYPLCNLSELSKFSRAYIVLPRLAKVTILTGSLGLRTLIALHLPF